MTPAFSYPSKLLTFPSESLKNYFTQFGEVLECTVMRDGATGRSRGFGFLTFKDPKTVNIVMVKEHHLDGKIVSSLFH
jgi:RNA-binding protein Musashi